MLNTKRVRPSWDEYFMGMAKYVATRATCDRGYSGCVIVKDKRVISTGYVGSAPGLPHCDEVGHDMHTVINEDGSKSQHCLRTAHAEANAIAQAARSGVSLDGSTIYCKMIPCHNCSKMLVAAGVKRLVADNDYHAGAKSKEIMKKAKVKVEILNKTVEKYDKQ